MAEVGDRAPDFTAKTDGGGEITLRAEFRDEAKRCAEELGFRALKLQPQYQAQEKRLNELVGLINQHAKTINQHAKVINDALS